MKHLRDILSNSRYSSDGLVALHVCSKRPFHSKLLPSEKNPANLEKIPAGGSSYLDLNVRGKVHVRLAASLICTRREFWSGSDQETLKTTSLELLLIVDALFENSAVELQNLGRQ